MKMRKGTKEITLQADARSFWWVNEIGEQIPGLWIDKNAAIAWALQAGYMHEESRSTPLRDHFAGLALQALLSLNSSDTPQRSAVKAYEYADAMMSIKEQTKC